MGMFCIFLVGLCFFQMFTMMPVYYKNEVHLNEATIGFVLALNGLIIAFIEMILVYKLERRGDPGVYMIAGAFMIGLSFVLLNLGYSMLLVLISMIVVTFGEMLLFPFMNNFWVNRSTERNRGQYAALYTMSYSLAIVLAPTIASQLATRFGFNILWLFNFFLCSFAAAGFLLLKRRMKHHE
jgi:predicted MFS family arabinose efflux permease